MHVEGNTTVKENDLFQPEVYVQRRGENAHFWYVFITTTKKISGCRIAYFMQTVTMYHITLRQAQHNAAHPQHTIQPKHPSASRLPAMKRKTVLPLNQSYPYGQAPELPTFLQPFSDELYQKPILEALKKYG